MKKKKLSQLSLKKTKIANFKNQPKGGADIAPPLTATICSSIITCFSCNLVCNSAECRTLNDINCADSINICNA